MPADELNPYDPQEEELVAYLDGELDPAARGRIERQLATDPTLREKMKTTQQAWDALDLLPQTHADAAFASTTMQMTVAVALEAASTTKMPKVRERPFIPDAWMPWLKVGLGAFVAMCVGFRLVRGKQLADQAQALHDIPVAERVDELSNTPSLEFLLKLKQEKLFVTQSASQEK